MLDKKNRLTKRGSFSFVYKNGKVFSGKILVLSFVTAKSAPKIGFSVNNKVGYAVVRNKIKRRMRAIIRENLTGIKNCQAVFSVKKGCSYRLDSLPAYNEVKDEMLYLLKRAELITTNES